MEIKALPGRRTSSRRQASSPRRAGRRLAPTPLMEVAGVCSLARPQTTAACTSRPITRRSVGPSQRLRLPNSGQSAVQGIGLELEDHHFLMIMKRTSRRRIPSSAKPSQHIVPALIVAICLANAVQSVAQAGLTSTRSLLGRASMTRRDDTVRRYHLRRQIYYGTVGTSEGV